ncbi:MAG: 2-keto-4-pentenoate hydratase [Acidobacteriaceae bacterium]
MISAQRKDQLMQAAEILLEARRTLTPISDLPTELQPASQEEAYFVQDQIAIAFGPIGGWKVGAPSPDATPLFAPMPLAWITKSDSLLEGPLHRFRGLEAEIAFCIGKDLPPRTTPYSREEVTAAIGSCHPAIEVLETAIADPRQCARFTQVADIQIHGGFVYGPQVANWQQIDFAREDVSISVDGDVRVEGTGSNPAGTDLLRLVTWLANDGAVRTGGLKAGDWITTGSWTGNTLASAGSTALVNFAHAGRVALRFA